MQRDWSLIYLVTVTFTDSQGNRPVKRSTDPHSFEMTSSLFDMPMFELDELSVGQSAVLAFKTIQACSMCPHQGVEVSWRLSADNATYSTVCKECTTSVVAAHDYQQQSGSHVDHRVSNHTAAQVQERTESHDAPPAAVNKRHGDPGYHDSTDTTSSLQSHEAMESAFFSAATSLKQQKGGRYPPESSDCERSHYRLDWNDIAPVSDCRNNVPDTRPYPDCIEAIQRQCKNGNLS